MAKNAANFLADLVVPDQQTTDSSVQSGAGQDNGENGNKDGTSPQTSASSASEGSDESADEEEHRLDTITISVDQLCRKLKKHS